jgi:hypothetical protein
VRSEVGPDGTEVVDSTGVSATRARLFRDRDEGSAAAQATAPRRRGVRRHRCLLAVAHRRPRGRAVARGGPDPDRVLFAYFEDVELAWRLRRFGWRCWHEPAAHATHQRGGAGPRRSAFVEELNAANRLLVCRDHEDLRDVGGSLPLVAATTGLKLAELALTVPRAWLPAVRRLSGGWRAARARHVELDDRARVPAVQVRRPVVRAVRVAAVGRHLVATDPRAGARVAAGGRRRG